MSIFNKVVVVLLLLVAMILVPLILIFPEQAESALRYAADVIQANLEHDRGARIANHRLQDRSSQLAQALVGYGQAQLVLARSVKHLIQRCRNETLDLVNVQKEWSRLLEGGHCCHLHLRHKGSAQQLLLRRRHSSLIYAQGDEHDLLVGNETLQV